MNARLVYSDNAVGYAISPCGAHSFATDVEGRRALIEGPLTGRQILFLYRNPAAARCCVERSWITSDWLDRLIAAVEADPQGGPH